MNNRTILIGVAAGVAGIYLYSKMQKAKVAAVIAKVPTPSLLDVLLGKASSFMEAASDLDYIIRARGTAHYNAWLKAVNRKEKSYAVNRQCFVTATGTQTAMAVCMDEGVPGVLEGY